MKSVLFRNSELIAIPFIDFWGLCLDDKKEYLDKLIPEYYPDVEGEADLMYYGMVNKEFEPEHLDTILEYDVFYGDIQIYEIPKMGKAMQIADLTFEAFPNTINDFLTLCQLAGVEIKWRKK